MSITTKIEIKDFLPEKFSYDGFSFIFISDIKGSGDEITVIK